ncbi:MAG: ORF6N domain-containing protein [Bacteroidales bacterium]|nr:ORF6N domain-containing protein [Bacteroidales bacterium]MBQ7019272.1 ORF6N domain-containing protein [Bacteroidales bacterium]
MKTLNNTINNASIDEMNIQNMVYEIRGQQVMLDYDLAQLYGTGTKVLNQAVRRNAERFPEDFIFQLSDDETNKLVTNCDRFNILKHSSSNPFAFTEQGVAMLSSVLRSKTAVDINISIMRAFVAARKLAGQYNTLKKEREDEILNSLENNMATTHDTISDENTDYQKTYSGMPSIMLMNGCQAVSALEMYIALGLSTSQWQRWYKRNITNSEFFTQDVDYQIFRHNVEKSHRGRPTQDFIISLDMAKHLAMMARTKRSHELRQYFQEKNITNHDRMCSR